MKTFDFYEFTGILVPGTITLVGILLLYPDLRTALFAKDLTIGDLGLFVVLAYAVGHLTQGIGNGIEWIWWKLWRGIPTDWIRTKKHDLIAKEQAEVLEAKVLSQLKLQVNIDSTEMTKGAWSSITRHIGVAVGLQSSTGRVYILNGNYGLHRGIAAALLIVAALLIIVHGLSYWQIILILLLSAGVALYRMHRFGIGYARELFVQFLQLPDSSQEDGPAKASSPLVIYRP